MKKIREVIEKFYKLDISTKTRKLKYVYARAIYFELCYKYTIHTYAEIANTLNMNHGSVLHSVREFPYMLKHNKQLNSEFYMIRQLSNINEKKRRVNVIEFDVLETIYKKLKSKTQDW